jgi:hypothetical protein
VRGTRPGTASGLPEIVRGVDDLTLPVGTREATVPRAYLIPADMLALAAKAAGAQHPGARARRPMRVEGEEFTIERVRKVRSGGNEMTTLDGSFAAQTREFPLGSFYVDMAQPMANAAFYYLEPQARDGFVGWGVLDEKLRAIEASAGPKIYPVFKMRRETR